ncbi:hypothetical protein [Teichococcus aestuarii]|uniref:hypothetical protein n=1 Tax=Teichococcus aestuarii TaxID=568898 RepID=UPI0036213912
MSRIIVATSVPGSAAPIAKPLDQQMLEDADLLHWFRAYEPDMVVDAATRDILQWRDLKGSGAFLKPGTATGMGPSKLVDGVVNGRPVSDHAANGVYQWDGGPSAVPQPNFAAAFGIVACVRVPYPGTGSGQILARFNSLSARTLLQITGSANAQTPGSIVAQHGSASITIPYAWGTDANIIMTSNGTELALCVNNLWSLPTATDNGAGTSAMGIGSLYAVTLAQRYTGMLSNLQFYRRYLYGDQRRVSLIQRYFQRLYAMSFTPARRPLV